jgi:general secretion pathway protein G
MLVRTSRAAARGGFTLTEVLVVVAIIVVLAAIAVPTVLNRLDDAKIDLAKAHIKGTLVPAVSQHTLRSPDGAYPATLQELVNPTADGKSPLLRPEQLIDPWGREYQYVYPGTRNVNGEPDIWSTGPNGNDPAKFIGNW